MAQHADVLGSVDEALLSITKGMEVVKQDPAFLIPWIAQAVPARSMVPEILNLATLSTAHCSGGRSCARLYLALQGMAIPLGDTAITLDPTRSGWRLCAVFECMTGTWAGNRAGVTAIAAAQPLIWEQAQAASLAREETERGQNARLRSSFHAGPTEK